MNSDFAETLDRADAEGVSFRLVVASPDEAVRVLRERFGADVEVVSVRAISAPGIKGLLGSRRFEVIARPALPPPSPEPAAPAEMATLPEVPPAEGIRGFATPSFSDVLKRSGFSERSLGILGKEALSWSGDRQPTHQSLASLVDALRGYFDKQPVRPLPRRTAFLGTAGSGRSTALGKWLGRSVFQLGKRGRVLRLEFDQPNRAEGLDLLCEALGMVLEHLGSEGFGGPVSSDFEYVHAPAMTIGRPDANHALRDFLDANGVEGRVLVVNAAYDTTIQRAIIRYGREMGATHLVLTHLDEIPGWGRLWDPLLESGLTPLFLSTGPSLTGGIDTSPVDRMLQKTFPGF